MFDLEVGTDLDGSSVEEVASLAVEVFGDGIRREIELVMTMKSPSVIIARSDGEIVGFKAGFCDSPFRYYSSTGAVKESFRKQGVASALMKKQHQWCRDNGFKVVRTETKNKFAPMIALNLKTGFQIIGTYTDHRGDPKIILEKRL